MSRVSKEQAAENRTRVVAAASSLFRRKGFDGVGIDDLMAEVGLTRGGFYGQFGSKEMLAEEACAHAFAGVEKIWRDLATDGTDQHLAGLVDFYFAPKTPGYDCPMASLGGDVARTPVGSPVRRAFTDGLKRLVAMMTGDKPNDKVLVTLAAMVGTVVLQRATDDKDLGAAMETAVRRFVATGSLGGSVPKPPAVS